MPRQVRLRKVVAPPTFKGYQPYGIRVNKNGSVSLLYEEFEALKLADYDLLKHDEAAELMGISRPTFARIYESARRKVAKAFVETKSIETVYGNVLIEKNWFSCKDCHARFTIPQSPVFDHCPMCNSSHYNPVN